MNTLKAIRRNVSFSIYNAVARRAELLELAFEISLVNRRTAIALATTAKTYEQQRKAVELLNDSKLDLFKSARLTSELSGFGVTRTKAFAQIGLLLGKELHIRSQLKELAMERLVMPSADQPKAVALTSTELELAHA